MCRPCPLFSNTTENDTGITVCPCDPGYYRAVNEGDLPCTSECRLSKAMIKDVMHIPL